MSINPLDVVEIRATWARAAASPWAGFVMRHTARLADGDEVALMGYEAGALLDALKAAGAALVESVEGWSRVVRVTSVERRVTSGEAGRTTNDEVRTTNEGERAPRPGTVVEAVAQMLAKGKGNQPRLAGRLDSAAGLVLEGRVVLEGETGRIGPYVISSDACTCPDFRHRGGWCKHRLAVRMARHLVKYGFELPVAQEEPGPLIRPKDLALIASGQVIDEAQRRERAYRASAQGARDAALRQLGNGAKTLPADIARRAGIGRTTNDE